METESRISYEDMKGLVEAMSEVAGRIVPGMSLFYQEQMFQRIPWDSFDSKKIWDSFDSKEIAVVKACPGWNDVQVRGAIVEVGHELYGRKKLLRRLVADGWPNATSGEEMKLKLAMAGDGAFKGICCRYAEYGPPKERLYRVRPS